MEVYTCERPFCLDDGIVQMKELRFRWRGKVIFLKNGMMKDLCLRHAEEVAKDNILITSGNRMGARQAIANAKGESD